MSTTLLENDGVSREAHFVHLRGVTWRDYERLLEIRGESSKPRYTYLEGELEIMSSSKTHAVDDSKVLPGIDLRQLVRFIDSPSTSHTIREYRNTLKG